MARTKRRTTHQGILEALGSAPPGASLTRAELVRASGRAHETVRIKLASMVRSGEVDRLKTGAGDVYRLPAGQPAAGSTVAMEITGDPVGDLRKAYEDKFRAEQRIRELEAELRAKISAPGG